MSATIRNVAPVRPQTEHGRTGASRATQRVARIVTIAAAAVAAVLVAGAIGLALYGYSHDDRLYEGIVVAGVNVGGMSRPEAAEVIAARYDAFATAPITVEAAGQTFQVVPSTAGAALDLDATIDRAFGYGRDGSFWDRSAQWARALLRGKEVAPVVRINPTALDGQVMAIADAVDRAPVDAVVQMEAAGEPALVPDVSGIALDRDAAGALLAGRFTRLNAEPLSLPTATVPAAVPADRLTAGLPVAQAAVAAPFVITSAEGSWALSETELREIVGVDDDGAVAVDRGEVTAFVESVAAAIDRPSEDANVRLNDDLTLTVVPGSYSATVDIEATVDAAIAALLAGRHEQAVTIERLAPAIVDADAAAAIAEAEALIEAGIELKWDGVVSAGDAPLGRDDLVQALIIDPRPGEAEPFSIVLDPWLMAEVMAPIRDEMNVPATDATFRLVDGDVTVVEEEADGQLLDALAAGEAVVKAVNDGEPTVELPVQDAEPRYTERDRSRIVVPDLLGDSATFYGNSSEPRRKNVERAVDLEAGWLIPPDGVFSYNDYLGAVDEANGFVTGFGIVADEETGGVTTAPVIGGGICQVATTIFQAAFWAGLKIEERWQHPYWLPGYGNPPRGMKGLDAMVNIEDDWALDMKFRNTTEDWIAVVVIGDGQNVTAQILGTDPGWDVKVKGPIITNFVPKDEKTYYTDSPELPAGEERQVETAGEGFDAEIRRTVVKDGEVIDEYVLTSSFDPSRNTILRGTGS